MLYLVATPIGNLADITLRAIDTLKRCDYILCEDTRHSRFLLEHHGIQTPLKSYHKFNEAFREESIISDLKKGLHIALISDAGTPAICDPGTRIVSACKGEGVDVTIIPGPCAFVSALALSGWEMERFQFVGFLPKSEGRLKEQLAEMLAYDGVSIAYETSKRLVKTLSALAKLQPDAKTFIARELTKFHEELQSGTAEELLSYYSEHTPLGEIVLLIDGKEKKSPPLSNEELIERVKKNLKDQKTSLSEAVGIVAKEVGVSRKNLYKIAHLALKRADC